MNKIAVINTVIKIMPTPIITPTKKEFVILASAHTKSAQQPRKIAIESIHPKNLIKKL